MEYFKREYLGTNGQTDMTNLKTRIATKRMCIKKKPAHHTLHL